MDELTIEGVAIIGSDGQTYSLFRPARHHHVIALMVNEGEPTPITGEQGFITNEGNFVNRIDAKQIAVKANQLLPRASKRPELFSEDVW